DVETLLEQIAQIGAGADGGFRRLAWTEEDARLGEWFAAACAERGLVVSTDRCGNQWAWWGDPDADARASQQGEGPGEAPGEEAGDEAGPEGEGGSGDLPAATTGGVVTGSHLDSVPGGGAYDG